MNASALSNTSAPVATRLRSPVSRNATIAFAVVALHVGFIWALQSGLLMRAAEWVVPAEILVTFVDPPAPKAEPVRPAPTPPIPALPKKSVVKATAAPQPLAIADTTPSPDAPTGVITPPPQTAPVAQPPVAPVVVSAAAAPAPAVVQMPSSDADYLRNPKPPYPALSRRLGEQGLVVHSVLIGVDGAAVSARLVKSSGFERLDKAAHDAIMRWRYTPGKRNGVPEAMSFNVPFNWVLE